MAREESAIAELRPDIYQMPSMRPGGHVYLLKGSTGNMLIDTGTHLNYENIVQNLDRVGLRPKDIKIIVLTHEHFDHIGATPHFIKTAVIAAHHLAANKIHLRDQFVTMGKYLDREAMRFSVDIWLRHDSIIDLGNHRIRIIHTPGHCSGSICLYETNEKVLFTGDTVLAGGSLSGIFGSGNISDYITSLQYLSQLEISELYPGHGKISNTPREDIETSIESAKKLMKDCKTLFETLDTKSALSEFFCSAKKLPKPKTDKR